MKIVETLIEQASDRNLRHFFGIPGGGMPLDLIEEGRRRGVEFVIAAHESSAAIMAGYYGHIKKTAGLALAIRGVGAANLAGGVANLFFERMPLVGVCETRPIAHGDIDTVQFCDQTCLFTGITKLNTTLSPESAGEVIPWGFDLAVDGRSGPVIFHLPSDLAQANVGAALSRPASSGATTQEPDYEAARVFLRRTQRPVVIAGADVLRDDAASELLQLVEATGAIVLVSMDARGVFPESHPRWAGVYMGFFGAEVIETAVLAGADAVLLIGVDHGMTHGPWSSSLPVCELSARKEYQSLCAAPAVRVDGNLRNTLRSLLGGAPQAGFPAPEIQEMRQRILRHFARPAQARLAAQDVIEITRRHLPADGILVSETGAFICMLEHLWPVDIPGTYLGTSAGRTMGLMLPALIGAKLADPERPMVGIGGDGSLLMRLGELETAARTRIAAPIVIVNDQSLGTMKSRQLSRGMPDYGLDFAPVEFASVAAACGLASATVTTPEEFERELTLAFGRDIATLIDARVDAQPYQDSFGPTIGAVRNPT
jgi:acetolactate synthase-1/2/3 large subunit